MKLVEPKESEKSKWSKGTRQNKGHRHFRSRNIKSYVDYINDSDYNESRKKFIINYYNYCLDLYNLREMQRRPKLLTYI